MSRKIDILLIEDDADDVELLQEALKNGGIVYDMRVLKDGSAALNHFKKPDHFPDVIVMDLNLPKVHGKELIKEIKSHDQLRDISLLILTTSSSKEDIDFAYKSGADNYIVKPTSIEEIQNTVHAIVELGNKKFNASSPGH
ncbi:MAG: response regulator [Gemmatimonadaceae bacterium]|nr:response regulator [Chitinophagaceae bacterium]